MDKNELFELIFAYNKRKSFGYLNTPMSLIKEAKFHIGSQLSTAFNECQKLGNHSGI